jgi:hypothetical protein
MVFVRDEGSVFDVPIDEVWRFLGSGAAHSSAHGHRRVHRTIRSPNEGTYSWEQPFAGRSARFTMRWHAFVPVGIAYEVLAGPFRGSRFFLSYFPRGRRTGVSVVGEFVSPTIPPRRIATAVRRFFAREFEQDLAALRSGGGRPARGRPPPKRRRGGGRR